MQIMATLECEIQYCPFKSSGEEAQSKHNSQEQKQTQGKKLLRRATKSIITTDHKGVLTVQIVSASNLSVCLLSGTAIQSFSLLVHNLSHSQRKQQQSLSLCIITSEHERALTARIIQRQQLLGVHQNTPYPEVVANFMDASDYSRLDSD